MAIFNPDVQVKQDPSYLGYSKPIGDIPAPKADTSIGELLKGIGDVAGTAIKGSDMVIKQGIEDKMYAQVDSAREDFEGQLKGAIANPKTASLVGDDTLAVTPEVPGDVQDGLDTAARLRNARSAKAFPESYYYMRLNQIAKDLRNDWPGYRPYIDQEMKTISGKDPANESLNILIKQAKSLGESRNDDLKKMLTLGEKNLGVPGVAPLMAKGVRSNGTEAGYLDMVKLVAPAEQQNYQRAQNKADLEDTGVNIARRKLLAGEQLDKDAPETLAQIHRGVDAQMGGTTTNAQGQTVKVPSNQEIEGQIRDHITGKNRLPDEQVVQLGLTYESNVEVQKQAYRARIIADGQYKALGPKDAEEKIKQVFKPMDDFVEYVKKKDLGPAYLSKQFVDGAVRDTTYKMINDPSVANLHRWMAASQQLYPNWMNDVTKTVMSEGRTKDIQNFISKMIIKGQYQPGIRGEDATNEVFTANQAIQELKRNNITESTAYDTILKQADTFINSPSEDVKLGLAKFFSDPGNKGLLSNFTTDGFQTDPNTGNVKYVQGRYMAFSKLVSEDMAKEMKRVSDAHDPSIWENYSDFVKHSFSSELFGSDVRALQNLPATGVKLGWDPENKKLIPTQENSSKDYFQSSEMARLNYAKTQGIVNRINMGLSSLAGFAKVSKVDPEAYMLQSLVDTGYDIRNINGLPKQILDSLAKATLKKKMQQ